MKVIFLDLDGVLNSWAYARRVDANIDGHFIRTTFAEGLTAAHVDAAIAILGVASGGGCP